MFSISKDIAKQSVKQTVRDKWLISKEWLNKVENRKKADYNHYSISKRAKDTKANYAHKKNDGKKRKE